MEIKKAAIENFVGLVNCDIEKVSLCVISSKAPRIKPLNLKGLSPEKRAEKLQKWGKEDRFILIIEKGDIVCAHVHAKYVEQLRRSEDLSLDGRKMSVQDLSDEQAKQVSAIGEAFDENVLNGFEEEEIEEEVHVEEEHRAHAQQMPRQQYFAKKTMISDEVYTHFFIEQMVKRNLSHLITDCMQRYSEDRREQQKLKDADDKHFDIKRSEIKKEINRTELKQEEIAKQGQNQRIVREDVERIHRIRRA
jgi:hypothetical protein